MPLPEEQASLIPEDLRSSPTWEKFNSASDVFKSYAELEKHQGSSIRIPDEKASPEDVKKWWSETSPKLAQRGVIERAPESPEKYEWKFQDVPDEKIANDKILPKFASIAHELGLSNRQATALVERFGKDLMPDMMPAPEFADAQELGKKSFGAKWSETQDNYKKAMAAIQTKYPGLSEIIKDGVPMTADGKFVNIFDHPEMIRFVTDQIKLSQDFSVNGNKPGGEGLDAINTQIADLRADRKLPKEEVGRRLTELYKKKQALMESNGRR